MHCVAKPLEKFPKSDALLAMRMVLHMGVQPYLALPPPLLMHQVSMRNHSAYCQCQNPLSTLPVETSNICKFPLPGMGLCGSRSSSIPMGPGPHPCHFKIFTQFSCHPSETFTHAHRNHEHITKVSRNYPVRNKSVPTWSGQEKIGSDTVPSKTNWFRHGQVRKDSVPTRFQQEQVGSDMVRSGTKSFLGQSRTVPRWPSPDPQISRGTFTEPSTAEIQRLLIFHCVFF